MNKKIITETNKVEGHIINKTMIIIEMSKEEEETIMRTEGVIIIKSHVKKSQKYKESPFQKVVKKCTT